MGTFRVPKRKIYIFIFPIIQRLWLLQPFLHVQNLPNIIDSCFCVGALQNPSIKLYLFLNYSTKLELNCFVKISQTASVKGFIRHVWLENRPMEHLKAQAEPSGRGCRQYFVPQTVVAVEFGIITT